MDDKGFMRLKNIQETFHVSLESLFTKEEIDTFFFLLTEDYYGITRLKLALNVDMELVNSQPLIKALELLKDEKPIQYILGETEFFGFNFKVNEHVLIPRPETEELVDWIISCYSEPYGSAQDRFRKESQQLKILDIGTGSGCIAVSLAKNLPNAKVYALDVSKEALKVAKQNAELNNVEVEFIEDNILSPMTEARRSKFDIIVSNPPYVRVQEKELMKPNVLENEPHLALFVEDDNPLLFYKAICEFAKINLKNDGKLFFEINEYLGNDMIQLLKKYNFEAIELKQDIFKKDRMIKGMLIS